MCIGGGTTGVGSDFWSGKGSTLYTRTAVTRASPADSSADTSGSKYTIVPTIGGEGTESLDLSAGLDREWLGWLADKETRQISSRDLTRNHNLRNFNDAAQRFPLRQFLGEAKK